MVGGSVFSTCYIRALTSIRMTTGPHDRSSELVTPQMESDRGMPCSVFSGDSCETKV